MVFIEYIKRSAWGAVLLSLFVLLALRVTFLLVGQSQTHVDVVVVLLTVFPVLATGIILTLFCDTYDLLPDRTRWIVVTYAWLTALSPQSYMAWQGAVAGVFVTAALYRLAIGSQEQLGRSHAFMGAFYIACATLLFRPALLLYIPLIIGLLNLSEVTFKNFLAFLGGIVTPFILLFAGFWFLGYDFWSYAQEMAQDLSIQKLSFGMAGIPLTRLIPAVVFILLLLVAVAVKCMRRESSGSLNKSRFYYSMFWFLVFSALGLILWPEHVYGFAVLFMIPASYFLTALFSGKKIFGANVWMALFILASVVYFVEGLGVLPSGF